MKNVALCYAVCYGGHQREREREHNVPPLTLDGVSSHVFRFIPLLLPLAWWLEVCLVRIILSVTLDKTGREREAIKSATHNTVNFLILWQFLFFWRNSSPLNQKHTFPFTRSATHPSRLVWCELPNFGDVSHREVCHLIIIVELDITRLVVLKAAKEYVWKTWQQSLWPEIMTCLIKIIHRACGFM